MYTYVYMHIKVICEKQGIVHNGRWPVWRLRKALSWDWLFLSCPVCLHRLLEKIISLAWHCMPFT